MASISDIPAGRSFRAALRSFSASLTDGLLAVGRAHSRSAEIERYMAMTEEELAQRGLTRDTIVRHVFRDRISGF